MDWSAAEGEVRTNELSARSASVVYVTNLSSVLRALI